jgi:hypothetical protein
MTRLTSHTRSPDPLDSMLSGTGTRELGTGYESVARLLSDLANAGGNIAAAPHAQLGVAMVPVGLISTMAETVRMNQPRSPLWRRLRFVGASGVTKLLIVGGVLVGGTAAAAATGSLPSPIQHSVTRVLSAIGIDGSGHNVPHAAGAVRQVTRPGSITPITTIRCPSRTTTPAKPVTASGRTTPVAGLPRKCAVVPRHNGVSAPHRPARGTRPGLGRGPAGENITPTTLSGNSGTGHKSGTGKVSGNGNGAKNTKAKSKAKGAKNTKAQGKAKGAKNTKAKSKAKGAKNTKAKSKAKGAKNTKAAANGKGAKNTKAKGNADGAKNTKAKGNAKGAKNTKAQGKADGKGTRFGPHR